MSDLDRPISTQDCTAAHHPAGKHLMCIHTEQAYEKLQADLGVLRAALDRIVNRGPEACTCHNCTEIDREAGRKILLTMKEQP